MAESKIKSKLLLLFLTFLKIGAFTFGGGYAMIALLENEFVTEKKWLDKEEFLDIVAIAESTPGPIAVNSATYIGYKVYGPLGSALATLAICIPSFTIIYIISLFFDRFLSLTLVKNAFAGIQVCVVYLILTAGIKMWKGLKRTAWNITVLTVVMIVFLCFSVFAVKFSSVFYILLCGLAGMIVYGIDTIKKRGNRKI